MSVVVEHAGRPEARRSGRAAAVTGGAAALVAAAAVTTLVPRAPFPPITVAEAIVRATPGFVATFFIELLQHLALPLVVIATVGGFLVFAGLLGGLLPVLAGKVPGGDRSAAVLLGLPLYAITIAAMLPDSQTVSRSGYALALLPALGVGAAVTVWRFRHLRHDGSLTPLVGGHAAGPADPSRREVVRALWLGAAALGVGWAGLGRWLFRRPDPGSQALRAPEVTTVTRPLAAPGDAAFARIPGLTREMTGNGDFYVVDEEIIDPDVDPENWSLRIDGLVDHPFELTYEELVALPAVEQFTTLECISNPVGGPLMSTAKWTGVPLADLLVRAGIGDGAVEVISTAVGGYSDSIDIERAMSPDTLIAIGMNGRMLPRAHGFPARLLAPGLYGMKQPKWLERVEVVDRAYQGYWEQRGWSKAAVVRTTSRIDTVVSDTAAADGSNAGFVVAGVAFAGDRGISRVEISLDGGRSWHAAQLKTPLSATTRRLWRFPLPGDAFGDGAITILARATDGDGRVQTQTISDPHPSGASGYAATTFRP